MKKFLFIFALFFILTGCEKENFKEDKKMEKPFVMLPKWKLPWEGKKAGKADQYDDYMAKYPQWYALTIPPSKKFRAYREYENVQALLLSVTHPQLSYEIKKSIADMVKNAVDVVDVYIICDGEDTIENFKNFLIKNNVSLKNVYFINFPLNSIWTVDFGPFPLLDNEKTIAFTDTRYFRIYDDAIPTKLGFKWGITTYRAGIDFEGGNFFTDEDGTCYTTQGVFWGNPGMNQSEIKKIFKDYLGCEQLIILKPLKDEGTAHIDMFFKMASKNKIVLGKYSSNDDWTNYKILEDNAKILNAVVLNDGSKLKLFRLPMPPNNNHQVWRTYINSTYVNGRNLFPIYSGYKSYEKEAYAVWEEAMPGWEHIGIISDEVITWGGAMHCISRTIPVGDYEKWVPDGKCKDGNCVGSIEGYSGECKSNSDCQGPKWLCPFNECDAKNECGNITYIGCCKKDNTLLWCENGKLKSYFCGEYGCGWNPQKEFYDCGFTEPGPPEYPKYCEEECIPNCVGKQCGPDGCGGSCGKCPSGYKCTEAGKCEKISDNCGGITWEGCCEPDNTLKYCENGKLVVEKCGNSGCGWNPQMKYYDCGFTAEGPAGFPKLCKGSCIPDCTNKECGDDGCGKPCGFCNEGYICENFKCIQVEVPEKPKDVIIEEKEVFCIPECKGKICGPDGCGEVCGYCPYGYFCNQYGQCVLVPSEDSVVSKDIEEKDLFFAEQKETQKGCGCSFFDKSGGKKAFSFFLLFLFYFIFFIYRFNLKVGKYKL